MPKRDPAIPVWKHLLGGGIAGCVEICIMYPTGQFTNLNSYARSVLSPSKHAVPKLPLLLNLDAEFVKT